MKTWTTKTASKTYGKEVDALGLFITKVCKRYLGKFKLVNSARWGCVKSHFTQKLRTKN